MNDRSNKPHSESSGDQPNPTIARPKLIFPVLGDERGIFNKHIAGQTEAVFMSELGIGDPTFVAYLAGLQEKFLYSKNRYLIDPRDSQPIPSIVDCIRVADSGILGEEQRRAFHQHVGDRTLYECGWWSESVVHRGGPDKLIDYQKQGKRSYWLAGDLASSEVSAGLFRRLSQEFELCSFGLSRVRREFEREMAERLHGSE